mgnify:CR=1 FL=1
MPRGQMIGYEQPEEAARESEAALCTPALPCVLDM